MNLETHRLTRQILNAAQSVHSALGCGFIESIYGRALLIELKKSEFRIEREKLIKIWYGSQIVPNLRLIMDEVYTLSQQHNTFAGGAYASRTRDGSYATCRMCFLRN